MNHSSLRFVFLILNIALGSSDSQHCFWDWESVCQKCGGIVKAPKDLFCGNYGAHRPKSVFFFDKYLLREIERRYIPKTTNLRYNFTINCTMKCTMLPAKTRNGRAMYNVTRRHLLSKCGPEAWLYVIKGPSTRRSGDPTYQIYLHV